MRLRFVMLGPDDPDHKPELPDSAAAERTSPSRMSLYERRENGMVRRQNWRDGRSELTPLANFTARIVTDLILDDGEEQQRHFGVEAEVDGQTRTVAIPAAEFVRMAWVLRHLGPKAVIYPGQQQHTRAAIQSLSGSIRQEQIFRHSGWRKCGEQWAYLHAGGAIAADGPVSGLQVQLPAQLEHLELRSPTDQPGLIQAVRASLRFLSVAPDRISFPLLASVYRATLGAVDFSLFLSGKTGVFKTAIAAVCQQHFGAGMDASNLPGNFASTPSSLEWLAFYAKDTLLVVDDFAPTGRYSDSDLQGLAERLFRAAGNHQGRSRLGADGRLRGPKPPRALVLATGEQVPRGHSIRARLFIVEVGPGDVKPLILSECQHAGHEGLLAQSTSAFVRWVAGKHGEVQERERARVQELRSQASIGAVHARTPAAAAELESGFEIFLEFAAEVGAISGAESAELERRSWRALREIVAMQAKYQNASDPALRFLALLHAALASGRAHVADRRGGVPEQAERWGWRPQNSGRGWTPVGVRIGWVNRSDLFLESPASYQVAQELAGPERIPVSEQTLRHKLQERGILATIDPKRETLQVRRTLAGSQRQVLHLKTSELVDVVTKDLD